MARPEKRHRIKPTTVARARTLRREMTGPEKRLWSILRKSQLGGFKFRRQESIGPFIVDFYCPQVKLAVEVDGETHVGRGEADAKRNQFLETQGVAVVRVTNDDVMKHLFDVGEHILRSAKQLDARTPHPPPRPLPGREGELTILDGATGTELDRRGVDISLPLWSGRAIMDAPDVLEQVHRAYLDAGADWITAATFRTHRRSLAKAGMGDRARELTQRAVEIAQQARDAVNPDAKVLGSVAPLEDCYRPDLGPDEQACRQEHRELITYLVDAGADVILIETMNCAREAFAANEAARELSPGRWAISFCTQRDDPLTLLSGESLLDAARNCGDALAVGVNCIAADRVDPAVRALRDTLPPAVRIMAYANIGYADDDGNWISTDAVEPDAYATHAQQWHRAGALVIGGCCGTTPATIRAVRSALTRSAPRP